MPASSLIELQLLLLLLIVLVQPACITIKTTTTARLPARGAEFQMLTFLCKGPSAAGLQLAVL